MAEEQPRTFEQSMERLEEIVKELDGGVLNLNDSLLLFEEGVRLARECSEELTRAQGRLEMLLKGEDGSVQAKPFDL